MFPRTKLARLRYKLFLLFLIVLATSVALLIIVFLFKPTPFQTAGYIDVSIATLLVLIGTAIYLFRKPKRPKLRGNIISIYKWMLTVPLILVLVYLLLPGLKWEILLMGLAWRFCLLSLLLEDLVDIYKRHKRHKRKTLQEYPVVIH